MSGEIPKRISSQLENIDLSENHLNGSIPEDIGNLKNLLKLDLSHNSLSGSITSKLFQLHNLHHLLLSSNYLSGVIPDEMDLFSLYDMDLSHNQLTGSIPNELANSAELDVLDLSYNQLQEIFQKLTYEVNCFDESNLSSSSNNRKLLRSQHLIIPIVGVGVVIQLSWIFYRTRKHWWKTKKHDVKDDMKFISFQKLKVTIENILSSLKDETIIGNGGSGKVYLAVIDQTGNTYAVKSIGHGEKSGGRPQKEFLAEVRTLGSIRHNNIVKLMCCISSLDRKLLVYECFEKQSLDKWLHRKKSAVSLGQSSTPALDWQKRLKIATGAAQELCYMHHDDLLVLATMRRGHVVCKDDSLNSSRPTMSFFRGLAAFGTKPSWGRILNFELRGRILILPQTFPEIPPPS
uniref:Protein kinase domain-containing protein n=1 Tax=Solanum lycopersicum TaxID=4081 RepID=A0A3Q7HQU3_SOLLC